MSKVLSKVVSAGTGATKKTVGLTDNDNEFLVSKETVTMTMTNCDNDNDKL